jgi:hypothetical protein
MKKRIVLSCVGLVVVVVLLGVLWWVDANRVPKVEIPTPAMPSPNAWDDYLKAAAEMRAHPAAQELIVGIDPATQDYTSPEVEAALRALKPSVAALHRGFSHDCQAPPIRSWSTSYSGFAQVREVARLLAAQAQNRAARGDWSGAMESQLDGARLGADVTRGGAFIHALLGESCRALACEEAWETVDHLDSRQALEAARRLRSIAARRASLRQVLVEYKLSTQASLLDLFRNPDWHRELAPVESPEGRANPLHDLFFMLIGKRRVFRNCTAAFDAEIAMARLPYPDRKSPAASPHDPHTELLTSLFPGMHLKDAALRAQDSLLLEALALRAFYVNTGGYPRAAEDLVPAYLPALPDDPFARAGPLKYRLQGARYVLYSIGPDGEDDGGKPIENPNISGTNRYRTREDSQGDIVAGVNTR